MKPTLKRKVILSLALAGNMEELEVNSIQLITASGVITAEKLIDPERYVAKLLNNITKHYVDEFGDPEGDDGFIVLENAILKASNATYTFAELIVFYDQIIAVNFGTADSD